MPDDQIWFKLYVGFFQDFAVLALRDKHGPAGPLAFLALMVAAKTTEWVHGPGNVVFGYSTLAAELGCDVEMARAAVKTMDEVGLIALTQLSDAGFHAEIVNWADRQPQSRPATGAERMRKHRATNLVSGPPPSSELATHVTECDANVTARDTRVENREEQPNGCSSSEIAKSTPDTVRLCGLLGDLIRDRDPKARPNTNSTGWLRDMRLLVADRDGDTEEVERVLRWSQADSFWQANILSPGKLRKQFVTLTMQRQRNPVRAVPPVAESVAAGDELIAKAIRDAS